MVWHIGNTTVRTPYRLREALIALQGTSLNGNLHGREQENAFAKLLNETEVVDVQRIVADPDSDVSDLGRKWRSALSQLGFITHKVPDDLLTTASNGIEELSGRAFEITPNGYRLIKSEPITAQQECFLRSLLAYQIPSPIEPRYDKPAFNPLKFCIDTVFEIEALGAEPFLSFEEFALFIQSATPSNGIKNVAQSVVDYRTRKAAATGNMRDFYRNEYKAAVLKNDPEVTADKIPTKVQTLNDYADLSLRYLKATGLFRNKGNGISFNPTKIQVSTIIHETPDQQLNELEYLVNLWNGATLPTDNVEAAAQVIASLTQQIEAKGETVEPTQPGEDIAVKRHVLEERLLHLEEIEYYKAQASQIEDISTWLQAFLEGGSAKLPSGETIRIPKGEAPAYLEWVVWRAFLAINSLVNMPWEARRFQVDQDFLPVSTAPGNGPDMIFEFADAIIVVEVTLTTSSRQEAAEGEPVRRHVAKYAEMQGTGGKPVYGLFIAINIDSNTAHTFRTGDWYLKDDTKMNLHLVPLRLEDFTRLFNYGGSRLGDMPAILRNVLLNCRVHANQDAPVWKRSIIGVIDQQVNS